jgi:hypothetical protein
MSVAGNATRRAQAHQRKCKALGRAAHSGLMGIAAGWQLLSLQRINMYNSCLFKSKLSPSLLGLRREAAKVQRKPRPCKP